MLLDELFNLSNKTAIVTGGGRGLGEIMAHALADAGANVVVCSRDIDTCKAVSEALKQKGVQSLAFECDVTDPAQVEHVVNETVAQFGTLDILINNSGTSWIAPFTDLPADKWDKVMAVNLKGTFLFSQAAAKVMTKQKSGKIINIASISGFGGTMDTFMNATAYNTSKGAIMTFTKDIAVKLAPHNIQVNAIAPGFFPTKLSAPVLNHFSKKIIARTPLGRIGEPDDLKGATLFLASNASNYITGHILTLDGGATAVV
ncbi:SDR family oxidoreductase [Metabacillus malikii]|uniref:Gluconate 5-dehydrogenase n=1 Tax=Metabacillus malikii TaxID=1504265 RepID=A0ABT9ZK99_9BACI|nr:SDR family oxidoreductase [Metabacillus malikii]MDQ0232722.1 gluconate 5-dehydrogenase [Metabacillus malikii]